jgi:hypothetical protein
MDARNFAHVARLWTIVAAGLALASCATGRSTVSYPLDKTATFDPKTSEFAIAVIGESYDGERFGLFQLCPSLRSYWTVFVNPERKTTEKSFYLESAACAWQTPPVQYSVVELTPGLYGLSSITHDMKPLSNGRQTTSLLSGTSTFGSANTLKFAISKGELLYFGDIVWGAYYPAKVKEHKYNLDAARAALKSYPGIQGELKAARFQPLPRTAAPAGPIPPPETPSEGTPKP